MNKEILTTDNINDICMLINGLKDEGSMASALLFKLNDQINAIKPGRPMSKEALNDMKITLDNMVVAIANEASDNYKIAAEGGDVTNDCLFKFIAGAYNIRKGLTKYPDKTFTASSGKWQLDNKDKLYALEIINKLIAGGLDTEDVAELFRTDNDTIIGIIQRNSECENKLFEAMTHMGYVSAVTAGEELIKAMDDVRDECSGDCDGKCSCQKSSSNDLSDAEAEEAIKEVYKLLKEVDSKIPEKSKTIKFPGGWYKETTIKVDSPNKYRGIYSISDVIRHMFDF